MPIKSKVDSNTYENFTTLKNYLSNYTKRAYLVGGAVRDIYLNNPINDLDIEVYDISQSKFEEIMKEFGAIGVGKNFFVYKWKNIDISLPRVEKKVGIGHKAFDVKIAFDEKEASKRRDFTINALMLDIFSGNLLDFWGGIDDIKKKIIKIVDKRSFAEDSLRVLRAIQFAARFGFKCDRDSIKIMQDIDISDLSKERIFWEFEKLFSAKYLHIGAYYLFKLKVFEKIFNFRVDCREFFAICREFLKYQDNFDKNSYRYYFLYIFSKILKKDISIFLLPINAPTIYEKFYKKQYQTYGKIDDRDILKVALDMPVKSWLESYNPTVKQRAMELGVYNKRLDTKIKSSDIINDGFAGKEISQEIEKRKMHYIENILKKI